MASIEESYLFETPFPFGGPFVVMFHESKGFWSYVFGLAKDFLLFIKERVSRRETS